MDGIVDARAYRVNRPSVQARVQNSAPKKRVTIDPVVQQYQFKQTQQEPSYQPSQVQVETPQRQETTTSTTIYQVQVGVQQSAPQQNSPVEKYATNASRPAARFFAKNSE
jgi:hypothetical protein